MGEGWYHGQKCTYTDDDRCPDPPFPLEKAAITATKAIITSRSKNTSMKIVTAPAM